jgi:S1/P1 Nuclease
MRFVIAVLALFGFSGNALAWGDLGHTIVCEIAFRLAQPHTRTAIQLLIRNDPQFRNFARSCTFPDHPRKRASEHFVNLPRHFQGVTPANPCPGAQRCTLTAIPNDLQVLSARTTRPQDRLVALKFLGHWVGDLHQPMHISFEDDRGGNNISVSGRCSSTLHSTWDTCLVQKAVGNNPAQAATALIAAITPQMRQQWIASGPFEWANESYQIARAPTTKYCVMQGMSCVLPVPPRVTADNPYIAINAPIVQMRLQQAGVRLADMLDRAFGN